jgi:RHS repeat-associated protein
VRGQKTEFDQFHGSAPSGAYDRTLYTYDADSRTVQKTGPIAQEAGATNSTAQAVTWTTAYDLLGDTVTATDPDTGTTTSAYDDDSELTSTTDQNGQVVSHTYDDLGRKLTEYKGSVTGGAEIASWGYDQVSGAKGYPTKASAYDPATGAETYRSTISGYSTDYQPTNTTVLIPSGTYANASDITYSTANTYTPVLDQLLTSSITTTGTGALMPDETLTYGYDTQGLPSTLGGTDTYAALIEYTPLGQTERATMGDVPHQVVATDSWEPATGRLLNYSLDKEDGTTAVDSVDYTYDQSGRLTSTDDTQDTGGTSATDLQCYRYDYLSRLTDAWTDKGGTTTQPAPSVSGLGTCTNSAPDPSNINGAGPQPYWQSYGYDLTGNRLSKTDNSLMPGVTPNVETDEVYDTTGHTHAVHTVTTGDTTQTYTYDGDGNPKSVTADQNGTDQPAQDQMLTWTATGQLSTLAVGSRTTGYGYDPDGNLVARTGDGTTTLLLGGDQITLDSTGTATSAVRTYSLPGAPTVLRSAYAGQSGTTLDYQSADPHGTATTDISADDLTVTHREYTPFGETRGGTPAVWPGDEGFIGGTVDDTTGLTNLGAREYDPALGRFLNPDPLMDPADPQQWNGYAYSDDDPINASDPTGKMVYDGGATGSVAAVETTDAQAARNARTWHHEVAHYKSLGYTYSYATGSFYNDGSECYGMRACVQRPVVKAIVRKRVDESSTNYEQSFGGEANSFAARQAKDGSSYADQHLNTGISYCMVLCEGTTYAQHAIWQSVGGIGFGGFGRFAGWTSVSPQRQAATYYNACAALGLGLCVTGGEVGHSGEMRPKFWFGISLAPGLGASVGINYSHQIIPYSKSWGY